MTQKGKWARFTQKVLGVPFSMWLYFISGKEIPNYGQSKEKARPNNVQSKRKALISKALNKIMMSHLTEQLFYFFYGFIRSLAFFWKKEPNKIMTRHFGGLAFTWTKDGMSCLHQVKKNCATENQTFEKYDCATKHDFKPTVVSFIKPKESATTIDKNNRLTKQNNSSNLKWDPVKIS